MLRRLTPKAFTCALVLFCSTFAFGQRDLGTITGTVSDAQGAAVPNATVNIVEDATGLSYDAHTNDSGTYTRPLLKPGTYTVTIQATGFQKSQQKGVIVQPSIPTPVNITLQIGEASQTVEVTAAAPLLQTETPAIGATLNSQAMTSLPLGGQRTFTFLARLSPGVLPAEPGARDATGGGFSAGGVRSTGENNFLLNGVDNNVNVIDFINQTAFVIGPSVEAIQDMQVITNGANAEYGRAGGGVVNVILKSGGNDVHGALFEFLQNDKLNANRWENNKAGKDRNIFKQNQFGGAAGGPIIKNRLFIFGDYQGTRIRSAGGSVQNLGFGGFYTIPTPAMIQGDFSQLLGPAIGTVNGQTILQNQIFDPRSTACTSGCAAGSLSALPGATPVYTRTPFPGNRIPVSAMDPAALKIASLYPAANQPITAGTYPQNDYYTATPGMLNQDQGDGRVDYRMTDKDSLFGSLSWSNTNKASVPIFPGILDGSDFNGSSEIDLGRNAQLGYTRIWSPSIITETRIGFSRLVTSRLQGNSDVDAFTQAGIGGLNPYTLSASNGGLPQIGLGRYKQIGSNDWLPTKEYNNVWDFIQNLSITKGNHSLKFGGEFRPIRFPFFQVPNPRGEMNFNQNETAFPSTDKNALGKTGQYNTDTGDEVASFLLGSINNGVISTNNFVASMKQAWAFYAQDDWKVTPRLTLNIGVRYELFSPIGETFGRQSNFVLDDLTLYIPKGKDQNAPLPPNFNEPATVNGIQYKALFPEVNVSRGQVDKYLIPWDKTNIGPRVGFAYNFREKTVLRGAYGIFYGGEENQGGSPNRGESAPFNISPQLSRPSGVGAFEPNPLLAGGQPTGGVSTGYPLNVFTGFPVSSLQFRSLATNFRNPMMQKWNLAIQQQLPGNIALEVGYMGNHQSHQLLQPDFNYARNFGTTNTALTGNAQRLYPDIGNIAGTATWGYGNYNALTAKLEKRLSSGLQFIGAYTYGHALANSGTTLSGSSGFGVPDPSNWDSAYSSAAWDIRHNFTFGYNYDLPFGRGKAYASDMNGFMETLLGNWHVNGLLTFHTGNPYSLRFNGCQGQWGACRPDFVPGKDPNAAPAGGRNPDHWFDTANVARPAALTGGNIGLQTNYAPPTRSVDMSIFKDFAFTERWRLQFRAETFNMANTPQFGTPDQNLQNANFGKVTSTQPGTERKFQFSMRLAF